MDHNVSKKPEPPKLDNRSAISGHLRAPDKKNPVSTPLPMRAGNRSGGVYDLIGQLPLERHLAVAEAPSSRKHRQILHLLKIPCEIRKRVYFYILPRNCAIVYTHFNRISTNTPAFRIVGSAARGPSYTGAKGWWGLAKCCSKTWNECSEYLLRNNTLHLADSYKASIPLTGFFGSHFDCVTSVEMYWAPWKADKQWNLIGYDEMAQTNSAADKDYRRKMNWLKEHSNLQSLQITMPEEVLDMKVSVAKDWIRELLIVTTIASVRFDFLWETRKATTCSSVMEIGRGYYWERDRLENNKHHRREMTIRAALKRGGGMFVLTVGSCRGKSPGCAKSRGKCLPGGLTTIRAGHGCRITRIDEKIKDFATPFEDLTFAKWQT